MFYSKERKVVCVNGKSMYVANINGLGRSAKPFPNNKNLNDFNVSLHGFVQRAIDEYKKACPYAITDGLFRVDVFQNIYGNFVVNEFESLEAAYYSTKMENEMFVSEYLAAYWANLLDENLSIFLKNLNRRDKL